MKATVGAFNQKKALVEPSPWLWNIREGSFEALVARPGSGSRPGLETATKQTVILPPLSSLLQHRRQQHCCQHTGRTLHTTTLNSTLARSNISCTFLLYLYCGEDFTKQCFQSNIFFGSFDQMYSNSTLILCNAWYWYIIMQIVLLIWFFSNSVDKK